jgi:hypothetical protein
LLTKLRSINGVTYFVNADNLIQSFECTNCGKFRHISEAKNEARGVCTDCGENVSPDNVEALDKELAAFLFAYKMAGDKQKHTIRLDAELSQKIVNLQDRYGYGIKSALANRVIGYAIEQLENEFDVDLSKAWEQ